MAESDASTQIHSPGRALAWWGALIPLLLIAAAGGLYLLISGDGDQDESQDPKRDKTIAPGSDVYFVVRTIELYPKRPDGKDWDGDGSGPDIDFNLAWQGNVVYDGKQRRDTLIGSWDAIALDIRSAVLSQQIDLSSAIEAAIIRAEPDTTVRLTVWDSDLTANDDAGAVTIDLEKLTLGDHTLTFDAGEDNAVKRVVVRLIDKSLPLKELVDEAVRP